MKVSSLLAPLFPGLGRELRPEDSPDTVEEWDSIKQVEVLLTVEEAFQIDLATREIVALTSIASLVALLQARGLDAEP